MKGVGHFYPLLFFFPSCLKIELEDKYRNQTCGLCGDNNGVGGDFVNQGKSKIKTFSKKTQGDLETVCPSVRQSPFHSPPETKQTVTLDFFTELWKVDEGAENCEAAATKPKEACGNEVC